MSSRRRRRPNRGWRHRPRSSDDHQRVAAADDLAVLPVGLVVDAEKGHAALLLDGCDDGGGVDDVAAANGGGPFEGLFAVDETSQVHPNLGVAEELVERREEAVESR